MTKNITLIIFAIFTLNGMAQYAPPAGESGTTAIHKDSSIIMNWASEVISFERGPEDITNPDGPLASFGDETEALGVAEGTSTDVVSLGDAGSITLTFPYPIENGEGPDFAVFENSFSSTYLELAHVEVSSNGERFVRLPSVSAIQTEVQTGSFGTTLAEEIYNLAGKYEQGFGTPFDLEDIVDSADINLDSIQYVRIIDVVGSVDEAYGSYDSQGNLINDPFKTDFESGGFDLDAVAVLNENNILLGVEEEEQISFSVYPNPTNGILRINTSSEIATLSLIDLSGKELVRLENVAELDLRNYNLTTGIYLIQMNTIEGQVLQQKLIYKN